VRAGVREVLALEVDAPEPDRLGEPVGAVERRGPADVVFEQRAELLCERRVAEASANASASSVSAGITVSGTNVPPYGPKNPCASGLE
jgi:hypothetical protein